MQDWFLKPGYADQSDDQTSDGFSSIKLESVTSAGAHFGQPGYETDLLYIAAIIALMLGGAGPLSIDGVFARRR